MYRLRLRQRMRLPLLIATMLTLGTAAAAPVLARAESATGTPTQDAKSRAQGHFKRAKERYLEGSYPEARNELDEALRLDPSAKDLRYNLGIVCEKMQEYEAALEHFRAYIAMPDVTADERTKSENIIRRIEGAKKSVRAPESRTPVPPSAPSVVSPRTLTGEGSPPESARSRKLSTPTWVAGGVTLGATVTGAVFGALALGARPQTGVVTNAEYPFSRFETDLSRSRSFAIVSDVAFGIAIVSAVVTTILYVAKPKEPSTQASRRP
jgi:TPR repeat